MTSSAISTRPVATSTGHRLTRSSSAANSLALTPRQLVSFATMFSLMIFRSSTLIPSSFLELEAQVQSLLDAARVAIDSVNAKGDTVAARLQNILARITEVTKYGAHEGAARAIAVVSTMSGVDYRQWAPVFPELGPWHDAFEELVEDLYYTADAVARDVSSEGVIGNLFGEESD